MKYFYVERQNMMDDSVDGFFWIKTKKSIYTLAPRLNNDEEVFPAPYRPKIYEISEEQYNNHPASCAHWYQLVFDPEYGFLAQEVDINVFNAEFVVMSADGDSFYAVFPDSWNGKYYEATECQADGSLLKNTIRLYPVDVETGEGQYNRIGYKI